MQSIFESSILPMPELVNTGIDVELHGNAIVVIVNHEAVIIDSVAKTVVARSINYGTKVYIDVGAFDTANIDTRMEVIEMAMKALKSQVEGLETTLDTLIASSVEADVEDLKEA